MLFQLLGAIAAACARGRTCDQKPDGATLVLQALAAVIGRPGRAKTPSENAKWGAKRKGQVKRPSTDDSDRVRMLGMSGRALSFGMMAEAYERFRPGYPVELFDMVMAYAGQPARRALEIGAGTGKATRLFAQRQVMVTATDPDRAMLAELRKHVPASVRTVQAAFEDLQPGERYGLVYAAAALHWTNPEGRWSRMAALLEPGGVFASFGGPIQLADPAVEEAVRAARAPFLESDEIPSPDGTPPEHEMQWPGTELQRSEWFTGVQQDVVERRLTISATEYVGQLSTISAYLVLPTSEREQVFGQIMQVLPETVEIAADITVHLARRRNAQ
ncbi:class I SAM-dependent methyltransferase [Streptomyces sp. NBC_01591]|uniref:class I SAM-dependent methyltransferase n=1 Tax=Streptomyces sp. NBC_01591 TaxID=2975888 RepID=UPI002DD80D68|nr:class I SAM-dependent methyltransferase [Streptomyces sp. NBC_01591]WSD66542.1 class I SAM-dependent methyltransferase [Streptomyces sp. NBC_01591]